MVFFFGNKTLELWGPRFWKFGQLIIREDQVYISGRSESLNKDPGKNDEKAIRRTLGLPVQ